MTRESESTPISSSVGSNSTKASDTLNTNDEAHQDLLQDTSFWGVITTQFLGAFNDNLYKQLMLLLALPTVIAVGAASGEEAVGAAEAAVGSANGQSDIQGWATFVFALPFVLFSGFAGYLSDRYSKTPIIVICKVAEIAIMCLGVLAFWFYGDLGQSGTWIVLFLMGTQSAFFGPGKYGILPELFRFRDLPKANALVMMSTFLAIILGIVAAGFLKKMIGAETAEQLAGAMFVCVFIAIAGTMTAKLIRRTAPAHPQMKLSLDCWGVSRDMVQLFRTDRPLLGAIFVSSIFWLVSGLAVPTVNRLGVQQLQVDEGRTSILTACIGLGIMIGSPLAGILCRSRMGGAAVNVGLGGIFAALLLMGFWKGDWHLMGYWGSLVCLIAVGIFAAIFSIPIMVFLQSRPPMHLKGRLIATMNQANFVGILLAGPLYQLFEKLADWQGWPISSVFWMMASMVLPLAILYRLDSRSTNS